MKILILHIGALGDCVLTLPIAWTLRTRDHHVALAARSSIARWAARRGLVNEAVPLERVGPALWPGSSGYDSAYHAGDLSEYAHKVISFLGGPDDEVSERLVDHIGEDFVITLDPKPTQETIRRRKHITRQWVRQLNSAGFELKLDIGRIRLDFTNCRSDMALFDTGAFSPRAFARAPLRHVVRSILVHPGSGGRHKCCPLEALEMLMIRLKHEGWEARWMIGPDEVERDGPDFRKRLEQTAPVVFEESIEKAADLVAATDAYVGNDAGMTHVAALAGVTTVALFGPTDPQVWRPMGARCCVIGFPKKADCSGWVQKIINQMPRDTAPGNCPPALGPD